MSARNGKATPPNRISAEDLQTHERMLARYKHAQELANQAQQLQAEANRLAAGFQVWAEDLHEKYGLNAQDGEGIEEDGTLIRAAEADPDLARFAATPGP